MVPDLILRSWQRSQVLMRSQTPSQAIPQPLLRERHEQHALLRQAAQPALSSLAEEMLHLGGMVILTDPEGLILDTAGDLAFISRAARMALKPGGTWSEADRGTNAIGTALAERHAVAVWGAEHYLTDNRILSCAATPILEPDGRIAGVLDISGEANQLPAESLSLVRLAAGWVEHHLLLAQASRLSRLHFQCSNANLGESILVVDHDRIVGANRSALQLLKTSHTRLLGTSLEDWFNNPPTCRHGNLPQAFSDKTSLPLIGRWENSATRIAGSATPVNDVSDPLAPLQHKAIRVLNAGLGILLQGETGVGKEVFARNLHAISLRWAGPFVAVNCAALPENLIESELFGYQEGAFSGARKRGIPGRIREAAGGILFLDEIGDMPLSLQTRLLRVLQDKTVTPLGGGKTVQVDFGLICATHRDLNELVRNGQFRADLLFRLREFEITLPSLHQRGDKAMLLDRLFAEQGGTANDLRLDEEARRALLQYSWPGNVRELVSTLRTLTALADPGSTLTLADLPAAIRLQQATASLTSLTHEAMAAALASNQGCVSAAAKQLGIHRSTLYRHLARR
ncbi:transcriptional activator of acetoin/glycerol metabolism [Chitinimonas sp. BJB300]|nr:transcriptional activator of acetoin/glycerol metabolism [Chitinimonas sp. BJB300]TSJ91688.1 sigma-54-dependent Fis family transcriptional regulator [Chitinimonas sp. BJB300]